jgi:hypothetical protein
MRKAMATRNKTGIRAELFGQMSNWEIVGEVVGGLALIPVAYFLVVLVLSF